MGLTGGLALALPQAGSAQLFLTDPQFQSGPIDPGDPLVGIPLPGATEAEQRAHLLWNLRAGLNVAALQCQFSPYLRAVSNYNAFLDHHSGELARAYTTLNGYFVRLHGARQGPREFDQYSTSTYNNFSTMHAQMGFCQTASGIAKDALTRRKGELIQLATSRMRELRSSLVPAYQWVLTYNPHTIPLRTIASAELRGPDCSQLRGRAKRRCQSES